MRLVYSIIILFSIAAVSCNTNTTNKTEENKIQNKYPFTEFDSMCLISINPNQSNESIDTMYIQNNLFIVKNDKEIPISYTSWTCKEKDIKTIIDFFSTDSVWEYKYDVACAPVFRNAVICYNKSKIVSTLIICFDCQMLLAHPCKPNTDCDPFFEDVEIVKDVFERNGLKTRFSFDEYSISSFPPPPPPSPLKSKKN